MPVVVSEALSEMVSWTLSPRPGSKLSMTSPDEIASVRESGLHAAHFRTADVPGAVLGKRVAARVDKHYLQPVDRRTTR